MIRDLPLEERPRERLAQKGPSALSQQELIAILLGHGTQKQSALDLAAELLRIFGTLEKLADATLQELLAVRGIGSAKAVTLQAAFALGKRLRSSPKLGIIDHPDKAYQEIDREIQEEKVEVLYVLLRDARKALLHKETLGRGILNQVIMHPREVFHSAIRHRAHSLIVAHNHPSGDPTPSRSDVEMTQILCTAGNVVGIPVIDHLIIGRGEYFSFLQKGLIQGSY